MRLTPNTSDTRLAKASRGVMLELPIPASTELSDDSFWAVARHSAVRHVEVNRRGARPVLGLFLAAALHEPLELRVEYVGRGAASLVAGGVRVLPMYQPEHAVAAEPSQVDVKVGVAM